jgi:hypothetical protein
MSYFYANINNSWTGTHDGSESDPYTFQQLQDNSGSVSGVVFEIFGVRSLSTSLILNINANTWTSYNPDLIINGPWRIANLANDIYINNYNTVGIIKDSIFAANNIQFTGPITINDTVFIATGDLITNYYGLVLNGCTLYGNLR